MLDVPEFRQLSGLAQKVVVDSDRFSNPAGALQTLVNWPRAGQTVGDLAWTRLTRWRELISQIFENRTYLASLPRISDIRILHACETTPTEAWYIAAWLAEGVRQAGGDARVRFLPSSGKTTCGLMGVRLTGPDDLEFSLSVVDDQVVESRRESIVHRTVFPVASDYVLMREELTIPGKDSNFQKTLAAAAKLAVSSIKQ
jgi:glucose-6-phosphate dehydrogenase assembly protein OpcA